MILSATPSAPLAINGRPAITAIASRRAIVGSAHLRWRHGFVEKLMTIKRNLVCGGSAMIGSGRLYRYVLFCATEQARTLALQSRWRSSPGHSDRGEATAIFVVVSNLTRGPLGGPTQMRPRYFSRGLSCLQPACISESDHHAPE